jgi:2-(1,2-epoxy-1,2-dihydrophenyl)acetyl-CoA isomerase
MTTGSDDTAPTHPEAGPEAERRGGAALTREGAVLWVRIDRPAERNALDNDTIDALGALWRELQVDASVRAVVVTGTGRDFCTGGSVAAGPPPSSLLDYRHATRGFHECFTALWELEKPVVSAVNGTVAGVGWMLALMADLVVAADDARWIHAFTRRGMVPHAGDPFFMPRLLPLHVLNEAALLGDAMTSERLERHGAVNRVVPVAAVEATARELADRLAEGPTRSLGLAKRLYRRSLVSDLETSLAEERAATAMLTVTRDRNEGATAFLEGRKPVFTGE